MIVKTISWRNDDFTVFVLSSITFLSSKILSSISFGERLMASLVPTCKMMYSGLCRKIGFILSCMSLTLAPGNLFTLTLRFWDSRPGCRPKTIESPAMQIVPFGHGQSSLLSDVTLSFLSVSLKQIGDWMDSSFSCVFAELPVYCKYFSWFFFETQSSVLRLI